jgi:hypothetical protein
LGPTSLLFNSYGGVSSRGWSNGSVKLISYLRLVLRLRRCGVVPPLPLYSFKSWTWKPLPFVPLQISVYSSRQETILFPVHIPVGHALVTHTVARSILLGAEVELFCTIDSLLFYTI